MLSQVKRPDCQRRAVCFTVRGFVGPLLHFSSGLEGCVGEGAIKFGVAVIWLCRSAGDGMLFEMQCLSRHPPYINWWFGLWSVGKCLRRLYPLASPYCALRVAGRALFRLPYAE